MKKILFGVFFSALVASFFMLSTDTTTGKFTISKGENLFEVQQRGCCSWHGGVDGCSGGRVVCNDGTLSPSCTCRSGIDPLVGCNI